MENNLVFKNCQMIGFGIIFSEIIFGLLLYFLLPAEKYTPDAFSFYVEVILYPVALLVAYYSAKMMSLDKIKNFIKARSDENGQAKLYFSYYLVRLAMIEAIFFLSMLLYSIFSITPCLYVAVVMLLCNAFAFKTASAAEGEFENIIKGSNYQKQE